jgi:nitrite reductase/ring-hydroxylating ferredoxin subunit
LDPPHDDAALDVELQQRLQVPVEGAKDLPEGESLTFDFMVNGRRVPAFVLRHRGDLLAWVNSCPHWDVDLDMGDGRFYAPDNDRIYCKNHGALFDPRTGVCVAGPCRGAGLIAVTLEQRDGLLWAVFDALPQVF